MKYKRLTISSKNIVQQFENIKPENRNEFCLKCFDRLAELEDKIEKGTLIELPCKVGDTVYWVWEEYTNGKQKLSIEEWKVEVIHIEENAWSVKGFGKEIEDGSRPFFWCHSSRFGIWWFLTREEAEKRLKELQE